MDGKHFRLFNYGSNWLTIPKNPPEITLLYLIFTPVILFSDVMKSMKTYNEFTKNVVKSGTKFTKKFLRCCMSFIPP